jgi:hypothetical protein
LIHLHDLSNVCPPEYLSDRLSVQDVGLCDIVHPVCEVAFLFEGALLNYIHAEDHLIEINQAVVVSVEKQEEIVRERVALYVENRGHELPERDDRQTPTDLGMGTVEGL